jgi:RNA polymerase sigma-70 factor (family 1)
MNTINKEELQSLLHQVAVGEEAAFGRLFHLFSPNIYTTTFRIVNNEWIAEEVVQDVFLKIWVARASLVEVNNFDSWLYTMVKNISYDAIRRTQRDKHNFNLLVKDSISLYYPESDYQLQEKEFHKILNDAIERLPAKQKATYKLIKEENLKREQVAVELNISPETVKSNLDHAMRSIRAFCMAHLKDVPMIFILHFCSKNL